MATNKSSSEQTSLIRIDIDGKKYRLELSHSSSAAELRTILSKRYHISSNTQFLDAVGYTLHPDDEQSVTINQILTEDNVVQLMTDKSESAPTSVLEKNSKVSEIKAHLKYVQPLSQSTKTPLREVKPPGSIPTRTKDGVIIATDLDLDMWEKIFRNCHLFGGIQMDGEIPRRAFKSSFKFKESNDHYPLFQVTDNSNIRVYMKDKQIQSSFLSSRFFDGGIEFSIPFISIGINAEYSKSKTTTNTQRKIYLTYCFNFPRAALELDLSYLEPTPQFIEQIDTVLSTRTPDEQIIKLEKVLSTYGHVYPRFVVLGGHLYHTEVHDNQEKADEAKKRLSTDVSFSTSVIQPVKIHAGGGYEKQSQDKSSEQTSLLTFEAVGGDTRFNRDPTLWTNSIADPSLWRIIEQDNYQSIITLLDKERQEKLQEIFNYYTGKKIVAHMHLDRKWKQHGITVAGGNGRGNKLNQLSYPQGIFINDDQTIYIADWGNHRIVEWKSNVTNGRIVAGGNGKGNQTNQLNHLTDVIIDKENDSFIIADRDNKRVMRWSRQNNTNGQIMISDIGCSRLRMDKNGSLYVSDCKKNEVRRWKRGDMEGVIIAGGNGKGDYLNQLNFPTYIFIDEDESLYVSEWGNNRVMKWVKDAKEGIVVAGGNGQGNSLTQLSCPSGVIVDQLGQVYVADFFNNRVMRWCKGDTEGRVVGGGNGQGNQSNQLNHPRGLSFDRQGNLYVADCYNHRIQKFEIDFN